MRAWRACPIPIARAVAVVVLLTAAAASAAEKPPELAACEVRALTAEAQVLEARAAIEQLRLAVMSVVTGIAERLNRLDAEYRAKQEALKAAQEKKTP